MLQLRASDARGQADFGWLKARYSFSFNNYYDPRHMGFRALRVINEDRVAPGKGFPTHSHNDMEILTYVLEGAIEHRDSLGSGEVLRPGEVQYMSAGTGVRHSEFNPSPEATLHLLQIWLEPNQIGAKPAYGQKRFLIAEQPDRLHLVASPDGREGSIQIRSDAELSIGKLSADTSLEHDLKMGHAWLQVVRGGLSVQGQQLQAGDGLAISDETRLSMQAQSDGAEILLFDLA